jgi:hypothetical protein
MDSKAVLKREDINHEELKSNPGKVDIKASLDMVETAHPEANIMVELDPRNVLEKVGGTWKIIHHHADPSPKMSAALEKMLRE